VNTITIVWPNLILMVILCWTTAMLIQQAVPYDASARFGMNIGAGLIIGSILNLAGLGFLA
jgi:hypothetical protein